MKLSLIKAKTDLGVMFNGADKGPDILCNYFINNEKVNKITEINKKNINKDTNVNNKKKNINEVNEFNNRLYNEVNNLIQENLLPITIGGDHSIAIGSALASIKNHENLGIIWIDSHGDYNTFETTMTGNIHGVPLATLNNNVSEELTYFHKGNFYKTENTVIVGGRDIDPLELENLKNNNITIFTTKDIKNEGVKEIMKKAIEIASKNTNGIHISFDIDIIDPSVAPGVSVPAINGINEKEAYEITDELIKNKDKIKSLDLVEFNPLYDKNNVTENISKNILKKIVNGL